MVNIKEIINDAKEALRFDRYMEFEEWYPAWMIDENGQMINNPARLKNLQSIFENVQRELGIKRG